jgi:hypothetical protein
VRPHLRYTSRRLISALRLVERRPVRHEPRPNIPRGSHFATSADGYLLNAIKAFPHVTVAQFDALGTPQSDFFDEVREVCRRPSIEISFDTIYFQSGTGDHKGYVWTGLGVCRARDLIDDQRRVVAFLQAKHFVIWTGTGDLYFPHLTFARLVEPPGGAAVPWDFNWPTSDLRPRAHWFDLALRLSDVNGGLIQLLYR